MAFLIFRKYSYLDICSFQKLNSVNDYGLSPLMTAVLLHDEICVRNLLDSGADPDVETPPLGTPGCPHVHAETQHWTALTYAALQGSSNIARLLLERGAHVEGGAHLSEDKCTLTPLQVIKIKLTSKYTGFNRIM